MPDSSGQSDFVGSTQTVAPALAAAPSAGSGGSWGAGSAGSSVYLACEKIRERLAQAIALGLERFYRDAALKQR